MEPELPVVGPLKMGEGLRVRFQLAGWDSGGWAVYSSDWAEPSVRALGGVYSGNLQPEFRVGVRPGGGA